MKIFKFKYLLQAWWLFAIMIAIALGPKVAYAAEVTMGSGGNLIFEPNEITISAGDTVTFVNGELPPHNMIVKDHPELSHSDLAFMGGKVSRLLSQSLEIMSSNVTHTQVQV